MKFLRLFTEERDWPLGINWPWAAVFIVLMTCARLIEEVSRG